MAGRVQNLIRNIFSNIGDTPKPAIPPQPGVPQTNEVKPPIQPQTPAPPQPQTPALPDTYKPGLKKEENLYGGMNKVEDYTTNVLSGKEKVSGVTDAQNKADRQSALERSGLMEQGIAEAQRSGLAPGSLGYQRIIDRAMSGAESNAISRQMGVNDMQRQGYQASLQNAMGLESSARDLATGERSYQTGRADTEFGRANDMRLETKSDDLLTQTRAQSLINGMTDVRARNLLQQAMISGGPSAVYSKFAEITQSGTDKAGQLSSNASSSSPAKLEVDAIKEKLSLLYPNKSPEEIDGMAQKQYETEYNLQNAPIIEGETNNKLKDAVKTITKNPSSLNSMDKTTKDLLIENGYFGAPLRSEAELFSSAGSLSDAKKLGETGQPIVNMNGVPIVIKSDSTEFQTHADNGTFYDTGRTTRFIETEVNGKTYWVSSYGDWFNKKPATVSKDSSINSYASWLANRGQSSRVANPTLGG